MSRLLFAVFLLNLGVSAVGSPLPPDTQITLERWGCLGTCPVYTLTISGDGSVAYEGKADVHSKGVRKGKISRTEVEALVSKFTEANFFSLSGGGIVTDAPRKKVSLTLNGQYKELEEGCSCVPELIRLENEIDKTAGSDKWVRGRLKVFLHWPWLHL